MLRELIRLPLQALTCWSGGYPARHSLISSHVALLTNLAGLKYLARGDSLSLKKIVRNVVYPGGLQTPAASS